MKAIQQRVGSHSGPKCVMQIFFVVLILIHPLIYAYEPLVAKYDVDNGSVIAVGEQESILIDASVLNIDTSKKYDGIMFNWRYYFNRDEVCLPNNLVAPRKNPLFRIELNTNYISDDDRLGQFAYVLFFLPSEAALMVVPSLIPFLGDSSNRSPFVEYDFLILDTFNNAYTVPEIDFCNVTTGFTQLDISLYANAYNSYLVVKLPGAPFGQTLSTPLRIGFGKSIMKQITTRNPKLEIEMSSLSPGGGRFEALDERHAHVYQFYWNRNKKITDANIVWNLADDINISYGAKHYPVRSPVLDRTNAATSMTGIFSSLLYQIN